MFSPVTALTAAEGPGVAVGAANPGFSLSAGAGLHRRADAVAASRMARATSAGASSWGKWAAPLMGVCLAVGAQRGEAPPVGGSQVSVVLPEGHAHGRREGPQLAASFGGGEHGRDEDGVERRNGPTLLGWSSNWRNSRGTNCSRTSGSRMKPPTWNSSSQRNCSGDAAKCAVNRAKWGSQNSRMASDGFSGASAISP